MVLLLPVLGFAVAVLVFAVRDRGARRRRASLHSGHAVSCRALLQVDDVRARRGRLLIARHGVAWQAGRGRSTVNLNGAKVLSAVAEPRHRGARPDDVLLRLALPAAVRARLLLHEADAALLVRLLQGDALAARPLDRPTAADEARKARRRWWPRLCLLLAALWLGSWGWLVLGGETVRATVTGGDGEGLCDVTWTRSDGRVGAAEVDCDDERRGAGRTVWTLAPPVSGEAVDPEWTTVAVLGLSLLVAGAGAVGVARDRQPKHFRSDDWAAAEVMSDLPPLSEDDLRPTGEAAPEVLVRLAPYAVRQLPEGGWQDRRHPRGAAEPSSRRDLLRVMLGPAFALAIVAVLTAPWPYRWYVLHTQETAVVTAVSTGEEAISGPGPVPDDVTVRYRGTDGAEHRADLATTRELPRGLEVRVLYAVADPRWARLAEPDDGLTFGAGLGLVGALLAVGVGVRRAARAFARVRAVRAARSLSPRPVLGTLTADPFGEPLLLICDAVSLPVRLTAVPLRTPLPQGAAATFTSAGGVALHARGRLVEGEAIIVEVPGADPRGLQPTGPAWRPDTEELLMVLDSVSALARD